MRDWLTSTMAVTSDGDSNPQTILSCVPAGAACLWESKVTEVVMALEEWGKIGHRKDQSRSQTEAGAEEHRWERREDPSACCSSSHGDLARAEDGKQWDQMGMPWNKGLRTFHMTHHGRESSWGFPVLVWVFKPFISFTNPLGHFWRDYFTWQWWVAGSTRYMQRERVKKRLFRDRGISASFMEIFGWLIHHVNWFAFNLFLSGQMPAPLVQKKEKEKKWTV